MSTATAIDCGRAQPARRANSVPSSLPDESLYDRLQRNALGLARNLKSDRLRHAPGLGRMIAGHYLRGRAQRHQLPDATRSLGNVEGTAGICATLDAATVIAGFRAGLYPSGHVWPMKWNSPPQRSVLRLEDLHIESNLRRRIRNNHFRITFDADPLAVMRGCAAPREGRWPLTWLTPRLMRAYLDLHVAGHMHSVEVSDKAGNLVGGLFGVAAGPVFSILSQYSSVRDASKVATTVVACHLQHWGFTLADGQLDSPHLRQLGFRDLPRQQYLQMLLGGRPTPGPIGTWQVDPTLDVGAWQPAVAK